jgi:CDP-diacylglycerol--glycerol-3-phosphate 3-phosphatidyltransferase
VGRAPLTFRRLSGLDRSGPPPPETQAGAPLRPWTIPNAIGYLRAALIPTFLILALSSDDGTDALPAVLFGIVAWGDYADGIAARVTRQYSRMGALMDPIIDRALVIAGVVVCWHFKLLPRWMLDVMVAREVFMLLAGQYALRHGVTLKINWPGRWAVWPVMTALVMGLVALKSAGTVSLAIGLVLSLIATVMYGRDAVDELRKRSPST